MSFYLLQQLVEIDNSHLEGVPGDLRSRDLGLRDHEDGILIVGLNAIRLITELSLQQSGTFSETIEILVRKSQGLESISLGGYDSVGDSPSCLQRILDVHRSTLHTISLSGVIGDLPDLSTFSSLRRLDLHCSQLRERSPAVASSRLPHSLEYLTIGCVGSNAIMYDQSKYGSRIGLSLWLFDLAVCHRNGNGSTNVLRTIEVELASRWWRTDWPDFLGPYEFLDDARRRLTELGISLELMRPKVSRNEWPTSLVEAERKEKDRTQ